MGWIIKDVFMTDTGRWLCEAFTPGQTVRDIIEKLQSVAEVGYSYALYTDANLAAVFDDEVAYGDIYVYAVPQASFSVQFDDQRGAKWDPCRVNGVCKVQDVVPTPVLEDVVSAKARLGMRLDLPRPFFPRTEEIPVCLHSELSADTTIVITDMA